MYAGLAIGCGRIGFDSRAPDAMPDAAEPRLGPSCTGLAPTCGPAQDSDCCESPLVPGGVFYRSYDLAGDGMFATQMYPATVAPFYLDRYEVTVGRFKQFIAAGMGVAASPPAAGDGAHPQIAASGWDPAWNQYIVSDAATLETGLVVNVPAHVNIGDVIRVGTEDGEYQKKL